MRSLARALTVISLLSVIVLAALPAFAHVTVRADTTEPGGFAKYTVRVPTESEDAATVRVEIELPAGYEEARYQPLEGWDISVSDGVLRIAGGRIEPGEFQEFAFSARNPETTGEVTFPAVQVYEDGEEVRWVGPADADEPAPVVTIEGDGEPAQEVAAPTAPPTEKDQDGADGASDVLAIVALVAGLLGLGLGGAAFARTRSTSGA